MILSLGEIDALGRKAARGAGRHWGAADEAGTAVRTLAAHALPGPDVLLSLLDASDGRPASELSPMSVDGEWRSKAGHLCPVHAGETLNDNAARLGKAGEFVLLDVLSPLLLVPFAGLAARQVGRAVCVEWDDVIVVDDGVTLLLDGPWTRLSAGRAASVRCRIAADIDPTTGERLSRVSRVELDPACYERLDAYAHRTYAPATEASRLRGAGGAQGDND